MKKSSIFYKLLSKQAQEQMARTDEYYREQKNKYQQMSNENLTATIHYFMSQMQIPYKYSQHAPVYDATFYYILVPELLRRLKIDIPDTLR